MVNPILHLPFRDSITAVSPSRPTITNRGAVMSRLGGGCVANSFSTGGVQLSLVTPVEFWSNSFAFWFYRLTDTAQTSRSGYTAPDIVASETDAFGDSLIQAFFSGPIATKHRMALLMPGATVYVGPTHYPVGEWHHVAMTREVINRSSSAPGHEIFRGYYDGQLASTVNNGAVGIWPSTVCSLTEVELFANYADLSTPEFSEGCIKDFRVYDYALTGAQIMQVFNGLAKDKSNV